MGISLRRGSNSKIRSLVGILMAMVTPGIALLRPRATMERVKAAVARGHRCKCRLSRVEASLLLGRSNKARHSGQPGTGTNSRLLPNRLVRRSDLATPMGNLPGRIPRGRTARTGITRHVRN